MKKMIFMLLAIVRIRGGLNASKEIRDTLKMLRLNSVNNCVLYEDKPSIRGMLEKAKDYITWGEVDKEILTEMLKKRLRLKSGKRIDEKNLRSLTGFDKFENFAEELLSGRIRLNEFKDLQPFFRLTPPSGGFKSIKEHYPKGDLGYRGRRIVDLLKMMI